MRSARVITAAAQLVNELAVRRMQKQYGTAAAPTVEVTVGGESIGEHDFKLRLLVQQSPHLFGHPLSHRNSPQSFPDRSRRTVGADEYSNTYSNSGSLILAGEESAIGSNRRYADHYDRLMNERILEQTVVSAGPLQSLTPEELRLDSEPLTIDPRPKPVRAWVRFGPKPVLVDAVAVRWTADAVGVVFSIRETEYRAWVWASAVTPVQRTP